MLKKKESLGGRGQGWPGSSWLHMNYKSGLNEAVFGTLAGMGTEGPMSLKTALVLSN